MIVQRILISAPYAVALVPAEIPDAPGPGEVLVRTEATFISAGTELANYTALDPTVYRPGTWNAYPWQPGYANAGRVVAVGPEVQGFSAGQLVYSFGKHASYHTQKPHDPMGLLVPVPDGVSAEVAAAGRMAGVAITALQVSSVQLNDWVVVFGLGLVGNLAAQFFQLAGTRVIGVDPMAERRALAQRVGMPHVLGGSKEEVAEGIRALTGPDGAMITVDAVGDARVIEQAASVTAPFGEVILLGSPRAPYEADVTPIIRPVHWKWVTFKGALEWKIPRHPTRGVRHSTAGNIATNFELIRRGRLKVAELISHHIAPADIKLAYDSLLHDKEHWWGVVVDWT
ncbi:MAG: zinc-binding dehydrogenase [Actinobacteria bacterium]|nr:zinc-binding dehydrogenase [Actinomycetota bacterium]